MKHFFSKYGFTVLGALVVCALLVMVSPLGKQIGNGIKGQADSLGAVASTTIEGVGVPSTLGYKPKDIVKIGGKNYVILQDRGSNRYLVMDINGIGKREYNTDNNGQDPNKCKYDSTSGGWLTDTCNNQYEGSDIDVYLNGEYYESLPQDVKDAIVEVNIQQNYYAHTYTNPNYKWVGKDDQNYNGCNNTACVLQSNGIWKPRNQHTPVKGEVGAYKFTNKGNTDNFGNAANTISRKVFLPSIKEVSSIVNVNDQWEMDRFLRNENRAYMYMWFRDSRDSSRANAMSGLYNFRSVHSNYVRNTSFTVRPAYVIDFEAYQSSQAN